MNRKCYIILAITHFVQGGVEDLGNPPTRGPKLQLILYLEVKSESHGIIGIIRNGKVKVGKRDLKDSERQQKQNF